MRRDPDRLRSRASNLAPEETATAHATAVGAAYVGAALVATWVLRDLLDQSVSLAHPLLWIGLLPALVFARARWTGRPAIRFWTVLWLVLAALALTNQLLEGLPIQRYGDWRSFERYLSQDREVVKWFLGAEVLGKLYWIVLRWTGAPADTTTAALFLRCASIVATMATGLALLRWRPDRLQVILPLFTPLWLLFAAGHAEYYPFIAGIWLFALVWTMERPLSERSFIAVGFLVALLHPLLYLGYAPHAVALLLAYFVATPRRGPLALLCAGGVAAAGILLFWRNGLVAFLRSLYGLVVAADPNLTFPAYRAHAAGEDSIFLTWSYALSGDHLLDLLLMQSLAGGVAIPGLLLVAGVLFLRRLRSDLRESLLEPRAAFLLVVLAWHAYYFVRMTPVLGPIGDIDLFFSCYLTFAFIAGLGFDRLDVKRPQLGRWLSPLALAVGLGGAFAAAPLFLLEGVRLPRPRWGAEEFVNALQKDRDPRLIREFRRGIEEGRVFVRLINGNPQAVAAGLTYDRWTRGSGPAALLLRNSGPHTAEPRLSIACFPPPEYLPVRVTMVDEAEQSTEVVFTAPGTRVVGLEPLAPGAETLVVLWSDKAWPGQEASPRWLGAKVAGVVFEPYRPPP